MHKLLIVVACAVAVGLIGCKDPNAGAAKTQPEKDKTGIFGKSTQNIGEFDPDSNSNVSDGKMKPASALNPLGALKAYGPLVEKISKQHIQQAVNLFHAEKGRYPKDYDEFMNKIIKANSIKLPVLPGGAQYQYDVENHELVIVEAGNDESDK